MLDEKKLELVPTEGFLTIKSGHISLYEYLILNHKNGLFLSQIDWFTELTCNERILVHINFYHNNAKRWNKELKFEKKFRNFHGCMLTMAVLRLFNINDDISYPTMDFFNVLAEKGNFTAHFQEIFNAKNGTEIISTYIPGADGFTVKMIQVEFILTRLTFIDLFENPHFVSLFIEDRVSFGLSQPEAYSSFEKMILPFDLLIWIFSITTFFTAFGIIFIINLRPRITQEFFYGKNVKTPALNVLGIFFGISQTQLPIRNFSRIILMTFTVFCLVLRTAYQGVLFTMMATEIGKPLPKTIEDLQTMNYTIVLQRSEDYLSYLIPETLKYIFLLLC